MLDQICRLGNKVHNSVQPEIDEDSIDNHPPAGGENEMEDRWHTTDSPVEEHSSHYQGQQRQQGVVDQREEEYEEYRDDEGSNEESNDRDHVSHEPRYEAVPWIH